MKKKIYNKGFTLLELLVAVSIFSVLIVLVVASFAYATNYQRRIRINKEVSQAARYAIDTMAREINGSYNGPITRHWNASQTLTDSRGEDVYNFAILSSRTASIVTEDGQVLIIRDADNFCRRYRTARENGINRLVVEIRQEEGCQGSWLRNSYLTGENIEVENIRFSGVHNTKSAKEAAYVDISLQIANTESFYGDTVKIRMSPRTRATIRNDGFERISGN